MRDWLTTCTHKYSMHYLLVTSKFSMKQNSVWWKIQSLQQRVDSTATLSSQNKASLTASGSTYKLFDICFLLQQDMQQSLIETNLLKEVNESPNCWSVQGLLKHNALPEGSFSARIVINISNKPKHLLLGAEERITLQVYLTKLWFLLFLHRICSKAYACICKWEITKEQIKTKWEGTEIIFKANRQNVQKPGSKHRLWPVVQGEKSQCLYEYLLL